MQYLTTKPSTLFILMALSVLTACAPLIGPYSPESYKYATSLKAETLAMMDKATEDYSTHKKKIEYLEVELQKAHEYVKGVPSNNISAKQWDILIKPDGDLIGKFFKRWKERGTMSSIMIREFKGIVSDAFDEIICLEASKKSAASCSAIKGE
jgi:hypothetical protein